MAKKKEAEEATVRTISRVIRKNYLAENKDRIVLEGLRGETSIAALCWLERRFRRDEKRSNAGCWRLAAQGYLGCERYGLLGAVL